MLETLIAQLTKVHLWQISVTVSLLLLSLGFTGSIPFLDVDLTVGQEYLAIDTGVTFFFMGVVLKAMKMFTE